MTCKSNAFRSTLAVLCGLGLAANAGLPAAAADASTEERSAEIFTFTPADGAAYFAMAVKAPQAVVDHATSVDHVLVIDTSASQVGAHREQALAVVESFLNSIPAEDRVSLIAVDVEPHILSAGFAASDSDQTRHAVAELKRRVPLGATDLRAGLQAAADMIDGDRRASVLFVGDGMSTAHLIGSTELTELLAAFRQRKIAVHSYAVGPKTDMQLLGIVAQQTGGVVLFDQGHQTNDLPETVGRRLAVATHAPVLYPTQIEIQPSSLKILPQAPLPLRSDRETIYLGRGTVDSSTTMTARLDGSQPAETLAWTIRQESIHPGHSFLPTLWERVENDGGLSDSLAGAELLLRAQREFDRAINQVAQTAEQAVTRRDLDEAERISTRIQEIDPDNARARAVLAQVDDFRFRTVSQEESSAEPGQLPVRPGPGESPISELETLIKIKGEQLTLAVSRTIEEARKLADEDSDAALAELKRALDTVSDATDIDADIRQSLIRRLQSASNEVRSRERAQDIQKIATAERLAQIEAQKRVVDQMQRDEFELQRLIEQSSALMREAFHGNDAAFEEAERVARVAVDLRPGNGPAAAAVFTAEAAGQLNKAFRLRSLRYDRFLETLYQVELSHVPFPDEPPIEWPPAEIWRDLTRRRERWLSVDLKQESESERQISAALDNIADFNFVDMPLREALEYISETHNFNLIVSNEDLADEGISADDELVNLDIAGITLRSALKLILEPKGLSWAIENEVMKITTILAAGSILDARVYPVGDFTPPVQFSVGGGGALGGGGGLGGGLGGGGLGGGGLGGGGLGGGGGFGGGAGIYSVPAENLPSRANFRTRQQRVNHPNQVDDSGLKQILDDVTGDETSQTVTRRGQALAQVLDSTPTSRFDNEAIRSLKKKPGARN